MRRLKMQTRVGVAPLLPSRRTKHRRRRHDRKTEGRRPRRTPVRKGGGAPCSARGTYRSARGDHDDPPPQASESRRAGGTGMTAKQVQDFFLLAEAVDAAQTHEDVLEIRASLQWLLDWVDAG